MESSQRGGRPVSRRCVLRGAAALGTTVAMAGIATAHGQNAAAEAAQKPAGASTVPRVEPPQAPAREAWAQLDSTRLWYWDTGGDAEPVILFHAATGSALAWGYQQPAFAAAGYRVLGYSRRGHYGSEAMKAGDAVSGADDLGQFVARLGIERFHAVGTAAGAMVATSYALEFPQRLLSLTIACSIVGVRDEDYRKLSESLRPNPFDQMPADFREIGPSYRASNAAGVARWQDLHRISRIPGSPVIQKAGREPTTWARLETLRVPTLLIAGGADLYMPPPLMRELARHIPGSEQAVIAEAGHSAHWERPEDFNRIVLDFLRRHPRAGKTQATVMGGLRLSDAPNQKSALMRMP